MSVEIPQEQQGPPEMGETAYSQTTAHDHYLVLESPTVAVCQDHCGHGCSVDPETQEVVNGKLVNKNVL